MRLLPTTGGRLLGKATVLAGALAIMAGTAAAQNNFTDAGTSVENTFTLDYDVNGTGQPTITNDDVTPPPGADVQGTPTIFTVDRLVDLTVTAVNTPNLVAPGSADNPLRFTVTNTGNDNQQYDLSVVDTNTQDFEATNITVTGYFLDDDNSGTAGDAGDTFIPYNGTNTVDIAPDATILVVVEGDIPGGQDEGDVSDLTLVADSLYPTTSLATAQGTPYTKTPGDPVTADAGGNTDAGEAEDVLADADGPATGANDAANDGAHSATATYQVEDPELLADKAVSLLAPTACGAATPAPAGYYVPGACVQYVITVENQSATAQADAVDISDTLSTDLVFFSAVSAGWDTAPTDSFPTTGQDCDVTACVVATTGGELGAGNTATLTIVARVK